jgi:hypothetical protein
MPTLVLIVSHDPQIKGQGQAVAGDATLARRSLRRARTGVATLRGPGRSVRRGRHDARPLMADLALTILPTCGCRTQLVVLPDGERTWTVLDREHRVAQPAERYLEYLRMLGRSPNTVKSYARGLALWWQFLGVYTCRLGVRS